MAPQNGWHFDKEEQRRLKLERLLKVAARCFNNKGFSGTSLKDVARQLNITDAALYYYVKNKEELVYRCYVRALDLGEAALEKAVAEGKDPLEKLELYIRYQVEEVCGEDGPVAILSEIPSLKPDHRENILHRSREHTKKITKLIELGVKKKTIIASNPVITSDAILGAVNWIPKWYREDSDISSQAISDSFIETFINGIKVRKK